MDLTPEHHKTLVGERGVKVRRRVRGGLKEGGRYSGEVEEVGAENNVGEMWRRGLRWGEGQESDGKRPTVCFASSAQTQCCGVSQCANLFSRFFPLAFRPQRSLSPSPSWVPAFSV